MIFKTISLYKILLILLVFVLRVSLSKMNTSFEEKITLLGNFSEDKFTIDMSYANDTVNILGHALTYDVKACLTTLQTFAPHCVKKVQNKWPKADHKYQRIPEFYYDAIGDRNFSYYLDFGTGSPLFEGFKCCIIYDILDCIHGQYKSKCFGVSLAPIDEVIHLFSMQVEDRCDGFHIENELFRAITNPKERFHLKDRKDDKSCEKRFLKNSDKFIPQTNVYLILITILMSFSI